MKNSAKITLGILAFFALVWACTPKSASTLSQNNLPQNVLASCTVAQDTFNHWFASGTPTENGFVNPANSVTFPHQNNCDFYKWSENMFLWITSPAQGAFGSKGTVLEGPVFYNVSPEDSAGNRTMTAHGSGPLRMFSHITQDGPNRLPVIFSKTGKMFEVESAQPTPKAKPMVKNAAGSAVVVSDLKIDNNGIATFLDQAGKPIQHPQAIIQHKINQKGIVERFIIGKKEVFLDQDGNQVQSEAGQATGDVLMAQNGGLIYYLSLVNDVYAWYLTASKDGAMSGSEFPTTAKARDSICAYARLHHGSQPATLPDSNALAIEIKTSWIEASRLKDPENYVTVMAIVPTYDTTNAAKWVPTGEKTVKVAMLGMHIVGSVNHHPEMVWATFEHQGITPNAAYTYVDVNNKIDTVKQDTGKNWLFSSNASYKNPNIAHMINRDTVTGASFGDTIKPVVNYTISPSNTLMAMPWGSAMDSVTNQENKSSSASNSEIISINNTIQKSLVGNDLRKNYLLIGATWTSGGAPPTGVSYGVGGDTTAGVSIGTNVLANSTMETYIQLASTSCFTCHHDRPTPSLKPGKLSHIYTGLIPFTANTTGAKK